jgi:hypothetical protein
MMSFLILMFFFILTPETHTGRTVLSYWWIFCFVSMAIYSGNLVAFLTVAKDKLPFKTMAGMVEQDRYKWGLYGGGALEMLFCNHWYGYCV